MSFLVSFTDGRQYDNGASPVTYLGPTSGTYADRYNPRAEWGIGAQNRDYVIAGSFVYELPFGRGKQFASSAGTGLDELINGWQFSGVENRATGTPIVLGSVDNGTAKETYGGLSQRPDWTGTSAKLTNKSHKRWFNPNVYSVPISYEIGNAPRSISDVNNPSSQNFDLQIAKNTAFHDNRYNVQCRVEMFNATTRTWAGPTPL